MKRFIALAFAAVLVLGLAAAAPADNNRHSNFQLFGTGQDDLDPENPANEVISVTTAEPPTFGGASRKLDTRIEELDNQIELKYWFEAPHTCGVGTPRIFLRVDTDGDGDSNGNAFGYVGTPPQFGPCPTNTWRHEDLTDDLPRWDLSQFGGGQANTWTQVEAFFNAFPEHEVLNGGVVDDTSNPLVGKVYFDLVTVGNETIADHSDTNK